MYLSFWSYKNKNKEDIQCYFKTNIFFFQISNCLKVEFGKIILSYSVCLYQIIWSQTTWLSGSKKRFRSQKKPRARARECTIERDAKRSVCQLYSFLALACQSVSAALLNSLAVTRSSTKTIPQKRKKKQSKCQANLDLIFLNYNWILMSTLCF